MNAAPTYRWYGTLTRAAEVIAFVEHQLEANLQAERAGGRKYPVCIWGVHGIGKTEIVRQIAERRGWPLVSIAPAQFEEMGDLLGMPAIEGQRTVFRAPEWVPREEGPGILLLDDLNRADDRILRGLMQLLQDHRLVSWSLPPGWQILLTANPDGGDYSVTPLDDAMLTRMLHISLEFNLEDWVLWAEGAGVDPRGIAFLIEYPEIIDGVRCTPRTLVQFFDSIRPLGALEKESALLRLLGDSTIGPEATAAFLAFVRQGAAGLPSPRTLLETHDFEGEVQKPLERQALQRPPRLDLLALTARRLVSHLERQSSPLGKKQLDNLRAFLTLSCLPPDLRLETARRLARLPAPELEKLLAEPELAGVLLGGA